METMGGAGTYVSEALSRRFNFGWTSCKMGVIDVQLFMIEIPHTVVETAPFLRQVADLWREDERQQFVDFIASNKFAGLEISGTGGLRKVRWSRPGMGKRGGVRVIYYYYHETAPLYLLWAYTKGEQEDLTPKEKALLSKLAEELKSTQRERRKGIQSWKKK